MPTKSLLRVEATNLAALQLYQGEALKYQTVESTSSRVNDGLSLASMLDVTRLAENAGVTNQLLLYKTFAAPVIARQQRQGGNTVVKALHTQAKGEISKGIDRAMVCLR
jgi:hypothetical protein